MNRTRSTEQELVEHLVMPVCRLNLPGTKRAVPKPAGPTQGNVSRSAFSLLELMIVLTMMVAIGAVAWPSLRRPMADSSVQQAANELRVQIADCRQSAAIRGKARLMRFEAGLTSVRRGPWNELVAQQLSDENSVTGNRSAIGESEQKQDVDSWELPIDIVVEEVQLDHRTYVAAQDSSSTLASREITESQWYLPFLPSGQTRDAVIVLRDSVTGSRVALEIEAITGMMRTQRLSAGVPGDGPETATESSANSMSELPTASLDTPSTPRGFSG